MKRKIFGLIGGFVMSFLLFAVCGCNFKDDENIEVRVQDEYVQWQVSGDNGWNNLISIDEIMGSIGNEINGKEVEFGVSDTHIQWRYVGDLDWINLIALSEIAGEDGENLTIEVCTITYDFNLGAKSESDSVNNEILAIFDKAGFNKIKACVENDCLELVMTRTQNKGDYFDLYKFDEIGLGDYFLGWYADDVEVNSLYTIGGNVKLTAKWTKDIAAEVNTVRAEYTYYDNEELYGDSELYLGAVARPVEGCLYPMWKGVKVFQMKDLTIYNGKFFQVKNVEGYDNWFEGAIPEVDLIFLPNTMTDSFLTDVFNSGYYSSETSRVNLFYVTNNYDEDNDLYYIDDYVISVDANSSETIVEYIYKVNYENCEAELINSFALEGYELKGDCEHLSILDDFQINKDGQVYDIKITSIKQNWFKPKFDIKVESAINEFSFIIGEGVDYIGSLSAQQPFVYDYLWDDKELTLNFYSKKNSVEETIDIHIDDEIDGGVVVVNLYYYSKDKPSDTNGKYWHYDELGNVEEW